jgi:CheY-like chemotaxis protein
MPETVDLDRLKRQFLAALNHEVRTPLSGILGMTSLLEQSPLNAEQREYVNLTKACAEELYQVLSSTLEFTALAAGKATLDHSDFLLHEAFEALGAQWLLKARQKGLAFRLRLGDDVPETAKGDELRFRKLLMHLLSNAVKFTERGEVELRADAAVDVSDPTRFWLEVSVRDSGIGMDATQIQRIFESFEQLEGGLARRYPGLGLGLTLAHGLTKLLGGDLAVESEAGKGSRFSFRIPMGYSTLEQKFEPVVAAEKKVLVVDDNEAARKVAEAYVKRGGYRVSLARSGFEAIEMAMREKYDLVLMDLQMPEMDGIETTMQLRGVTGYERTPIVALTANAGDEYRTLCLSNGMQGYLPKPVDSGDLLRVLKQLL